MRYGLTANTLESLYFNAFGVQPLYVDDMMIGRVFFCGPRGTTFIGDAHLGLAEGHDGSPERRSRTLIAMLHPDGLYEQAELREGRPACARVGIWDEGGIDTLAIVQRIPAPLLERRRTINEYLSDVRRQHAALADGLLLQLLNRF